VITELGTGEALVSTLDLKGAPSMVARTLIRPPSSKMGPPDAAVKASVQAASPVGRKYDVAIDRESAYELLMGREAAAAKEQADIKAKVDHDAAAAAEARRAQVEAKRAAPAPKAAPRSRAQTPVEAITNTVVRTAGRELTQYIFRGIFGSRRR
jgi:hypothetical protein